MTVLFPIKPAEKIEITSLIRIPATARLAGPGAACENPRRDQGAAKKIGTGIALTAKALASFRKRGQHVAARLKSGGPACPGGNVPNFTKTVEEDA